MTSRLAPVPLLLASMLLLAGCDTGKGIAEDCSSDDECSSGCCYDAQAITPWCTESYDSCMGDSGSSGSGSPIASCTDLENGVCTEILGGDRDAFQTQCDREGNLSSSSGCASNGSGPTCLNANITSAGVRVVANIRWPSDFCSRYPYIDTKGTCVEDLGGSATGTHCPPPN